MSDIEKRLRDALGAAAETVEENRPQRPLPPRKSRRSRFPVWFLPLCAAASVIAIVVAVAGLRLLHREPKPLVTPPMPRFFVASVLSEGNAPSRLEVRDTRTGALLDMRQAPANVDFRSVAAVRTDRTYLVAMEESSAAQESGSDCRPQISKVVVDARGRIVDVSTVVGASKIGTNLSITALAAAPDGSRIAFTMDSCQADTQGPDITRLAVLDIPNGSERTWSGRPGEVLESLSMAAQGRYLFIFRRTVEIGQESPEKWRGQGLYRIDLSTDKGGRFVESGVLVRGLTPGYHLMTAAASPDAERILFAEQRVQVAGMVSGDSDQSSHSPSGTREPFDLTEASAVDGRTLRRVRIRPSADLDGSWIKFDASGRYLFTEAGITDVVSGRPGPTMKSFVGAFDVAW